MSILINFLLVVHVIVSLLMIFMILMQRPKSEGLGAAFAGGVTENIFGAQTTTVLTKFTGWLAGMFFALTLTLSILYAHKNAPDSAFHRELMKAPPPAPAKPGASAQPNPANPQASAAPAVMEPAAPGNTAPRDTPAAPRPEDAAVGVVPPASAPLAPAASASPSAPTGSPQQ